MNHLTWINHPALLHYKNQQLSSVGITPKSARCTIATDLTDSWQPALVDAGFDPQSASVWLLEGFLFYLAPELILQLLDEVTRLTAPGSWLGFDIVNGAMLTSPLTRQWIEMQAEAGAPWIGTLEDPVGYLGTQGWGATLTQAGQPDANYGRWTYPVYPTEMPDMPHNWFVLAQKTGV